MEVNIIDFGYDILDIVAEDILTNENLKDILVITPNRRSALFLKYYLAQKAKKPLISPGIFALEDFIREVYFKYSKNPKRILNIYEQGWIIYNITKEYFDDPFFKNWANFMLWSIRIANTIAEFLKELKEPKDILFVEVESERLKTILTNLGNIYKKFTEKLKELNATTNELILKEMKDEDIEIDFNKIYLVGMFILTKSELSLIKKITKDKTTKIYIHMDPLDIKKHTKEWLRELGISERELKKLKSDNTTNIKFIESYSLHAEIEILKDKVKEIGFSRDPKKIAIVSPVKENALPVYIAIKNLTDEVNVTIGFPFKKTSLFRFLKELLTLNLTEKDNYYDSDNVISILEALNSIESLIMVDKITSYGAKYINLETLNSILSNFVLWKEINGIISKTKKIRRLKEASDLIKESLKIYTKYNSKDTEVAFAISILDSVTPILEDSIFSEEELDSKSLARIVLSLLERVHLPLEGDPLRGIQIMGMLETRNLSFENCFIIDVNEGFYPTIEEVDTIIPEGLKYSVGLRKREDIEEIEYYYFERLIKSSKNSYILWQSNITTGEDGISTKLTKSRFIERLLWEIEKKRRIINPPDLIEIHHFRISPEILKKEDPIPKETDRDRILQTINQISPSKLILYLSCPLKFYYSEIINLKPKMDIKEIRHDVIGNIIHETLNDYFLSFSPNGEPPIALTDKNKLSFDKLWAIFEQKVKNSEELSKMSKERQFLMIKSIEYAFKKFIEKFEPTVIYALEKELTDPIEIIDLTDNKKIQITLQGRIDRIDLSKGKDDNNPTYIVIDYKTGSFPSKKISAKKLEELLKEIHELKSKTDMLEKFPKTILEEINDKLIHIQLVSYIYLLSKELQTKDIDARYVKIGKIRDEDKADTIFNKTEDIEKAKEMVLEGFPVILEYLVNHIIHSPYWWPTENGDNCRYCDYRIICNYSKI